MELERDDSYRGPGMPLAYEQVKDLVEAQKAHGAHIDTKSSTMLAVATALVGLTVPLVLSQFGREETFRYSCILLWGAIVPVLAYIVTAWYFLQTYRLREYSDVNEPQGVKQIISRSPEAAYESLYKLVEKAYIRNKEINEGKVKNFKCLLIATLTQTSIIIVWSFLVAFFSLGT